MSKKHEVPTIAPKFDLAAYARESERRLAPSGLVQKREKSGLSGTMAIPKAAPTGIDEDLDPKVTLASVPKVVAHERVTEMLTYPTESFLLGFIDGALTVADLADASGLPRDLVVVTVTDLARSGVVVIRTR